MNTKEEFFDLTSKNVNYLGQVISQCISNNINLVCFSRESMSHPELSITEIPGLSTLFIKACLQHGLLGYLDWKNETAPSEQNSIIITNVIIATCGKVVDDGFAGGKGIAHDVDEKKLNFIRTNSRKKFNELTNK